MKRASLYIYLVSLALLLSACGSNNIEDSVSTSVEEVNGYAFTETVDTLLIDSYKMYTIRFKLVEDGFSASGQTVQFKAFDSQFGTIEMTSTVTDENGLGSFIYNPPATMPASGTNKIIQYVYRYTDDKGDDQELVQNITLNFHFNPQDDNGRATTLSISYTTSTCTDKGIIGHYYVHAVDRLSNVPVVGIPVKFSLINGVKEFNNAKIQEATGSLKNSVPFSFTDEKSNFSTQTNVKNGDNLIIFPSQGKTDISYLGGWSIDSVGKALTLDGVYPNIISTNNLTYIIGNEERLLGGENGSRGVLTVAHVEEVDATTDNEGYAYFDIVFDAILAGHTVTVEAHGHDNGKRMGISSREALRLDHFSAPETIILNSGGVRTVGIPITIEPSCLGKQPLIDVPIGMNSFTIEPNEHCRLVGGDFHTDGNGVMRIEVATDGNTSVTGGEDECTITWEGGISSLRYEY